MKLTKAERLILWNQFRILQILEPKQKAWYEHCGETVADGYEGMYDDLAANITDDTMSEAQCKEVGEILYVFDRIRTGLSRLKPAERKEMATGLTFDGFDGNDDTEGKYMSYARHFCDQTGQRYTALAAAAGDFNSHSPSLSRYRRIMKVWEGVKNKSELSKTDWSALSNAALNH